MKPKVLCYIVYTHRVSQSFKVSMFCSRS